MIYVTPAIPLHRDTRNAWRLANAKLIKHASSPPPGSIFINLGKADLGQVREGVHLFNKPDVVSKLLTPGSMRRYFGDFLPPRRLRNSSAYWLKGPGRHGRNKTKLSGSVQALPDADWDTQKHIDGQEYRIITVGRKIIQCHKMNYVSERINPMTATMSEVFSHIFSSDSERRYLWTPRVEVPKYVRRLVRHAQETLNDEMTVIGWDVIDDGERAYILEGNTCPGVNEKTAKRIVEAVTNLVNTTNQTQ